MRQYYDVEEAQTKLDDRRSSIHKNRPQSPFIDVSKAFTGISHDINTIIRPVIRDMFVTNCLRPLTSMLALAPQVQEKIQERRRILFDAESYNSRIHKELGQGKDFSNSSVVKLRVKLEEANKSLALCQATIYDLFNLFDESVPSLVIDELSVAISCLKHYHSSSACLLGNMLPKISSAEASLKQLQLAQNLPTEEFPSNNLIKEKIKDKIEISIPEPRFHAQHRSSSVVDQMNIQVELTEADDPTATRRDMDMVKQELSGLFAQANDSADGKKLGSLSRRPSALLPSSPSSAVAQDTSATSIPNPVATHSLLTSGGYTGSTATEPQHRATAAVSRGATNISPMVYRPHHHDNTSSGSSSSPFRGGSHGLTNRDVHSSSPTNLYSIHEDTDDANESFGRLSPLNIPRRLSPTPHSESNHSSHSKPARRTSVADTSSSRAVSESIVNSSLNGKIHD
jgi:hypothetical protein